MKTINPKKIKSFYAYIVRYYLFVIKTKHYIEIVYYIGDHYHHLHVDKYSLNLIKGI
jgi:hypothetical protein